MTHAPGKSSHKDSGFRFIEQTLHPPLIVASLFLEAHQLPEKGNCPVVGPHKEESCANPRDIGESASLVFKVTVAIPRRTYMKGEISQDKTEVSSILHDLPSRSNEVTRSGMIE